MTPILYPPRIFAGTTTGISTVLSTEDAVQHMGVSPQASAAYDIICDAGYPDEEAIWHMVLAAERDGHDPEKWARSFVRLRKAARG